MTEWNPTVGDPSQPIVLGFDQQLSVDGGPDRLTHSDVSKLGRSGVEAEVHRRDTRRAWRFEARVVPEHRKQQWGNGADREIALPCKHSERARVVVADHHQSKAGNPWSAPVPVGIRPKLEDTRRTPHQTIGSGAHWEWVLFRGDPMVRVDASNDRQLEVRQKGRVRLAQHESQGVRIDYLDALDPPISMRVPALELGIDDAAEGGRDILRIEWPTITKAKFLSQSNFVLGRARRHDRFRKVGNHLERSRVDGHQGGEEQSRDAEAVGIGNKPGIQLLGISRKDDYEGFGIAGDFLGATHADH